MWEGSYTMERWEGVTNSKDACSIHGMAVFMCRLLKCEFQIQRSPHFLPKCIFYLQAPLAHSSVKVFSPSDHCAGGTVELTLVTSAKGCFCDHVNLWFGRNCFRTCKWLSEESEGVLVMACNMMSYTSPPLSIYWETFSVAFSVPSLPLLPCSP